MWNIQRYYAFSLFKDTSCRQHVDITKLSIHNTINSNTMSLYVLNSQYLKVIWELCVEYSMFFYGFNLLEETI